MLTLILPQDNNNIMHVQIFTKVLHGYSLTGLLLAIGFRNHQIDFVHATTKLMAL